MITSKKYNDVLEVIILSMHCDDFLNMMDKTEVTVDEFNEAWYMITSIKDTLAAYEKDEEERR